MRKGGNIQRVQEVPKSMKIAKQKQNNRKQRQKATWKKQQKNYNTIYKIVAYAFDFT